MTFENKFAAALTKVVADRAHATAMGQAGRARAITEFGWDKIAEQTIAVYRSAQEVFEAK